LNESVVGPVAYPSAVGKVKSILQLSDIVIVPVNVGLAVGAALMSERTSE
jgi:hypothetical protein